MNALNFFFIIFSSIKLSKSLIPIWDLKNSSFDLLETSNTNEIIIYEKKEDNLHTVLSKSITRDKDGKISEKNYIMMLDNEIKNETKWEDIENAYFIANSGHYVCPKGKYFLHHYDNRQLYEIIPKDFDNYDNINWELKCIYHYSEETQSMIVAFLNTELSKNLYGKYFIKFTSSDKTDWKSLSLEDLAYDVVIGKSKIGSDLIYNTYGLTAKEGKIAISNYQLKIDIQNNQIFESTEKNYIQLVNKLKYSDGCIINSNKIFYWMTANNIDDFTSGYSTESLHYSDSSEANTKVPLKNNTYSPFILLNEFEIKKLNIIKYTRFVYYELYNKEYNINYKGIIDIELNLIIFNTDVETTKFQPYGNYTIFIIAGKDAYKTCLIKYNNECVDRCPENTKLVIDNINGNHCDSQCKKYTLKPSDVCIDYCNLTLYSYDENKKICGLCKDIGDKKYKLMGYNTCFDKVEDGTYLFNEKYNLLKNCSEFCKKCDNSETCTECNDGYILDKNTKKCVMREGCYDNCLDCSAFSDKEDNQKCYSCKPGFYYHYGNCIKNCPEKFYKNGVNCTGCHENCKKCSKGEEIDKNGIAHQNCEICKEEFNYLIKAEGFSRNCTNICPNGTNVSESGDSCILIQNDNGKNNNKDDHFLYIFSIIIGLILFICLIFIYKNICSRKKSDNEIISEIHTELQENANKLLTD